MECDEDEANYNDNDDKRSPIWTEARSVYIQLKSLVDSLKISHDDDSGTSNDIIHICWGGRGRGVGGGGEVGWLR